MSSKATPLESLEAAVNRAGSQASFARICGVSQPAVWKWLQSGKRLPAEHVLIVERETGVSRHLLRPDIYPADLGPLAPCDGDDADLPAATPPVACDRHPASHRERAA